MTKFDQILKEFTNNLNNQNQTNQNTTNNQNQTNNTSVPNQTNNNQQTADIETISQALAKNNNPQFYQKIQNSTKPEEIKQAILDSLK